MVSESNCLLLFFATTTVSAIDKPSGICKGSAVNNRDVFFSTTSTWHLQDMVVDCPA